MGEENNLFLGEIILESLVDLDVLLPYTNYLVMERTAELPNEVVPFWHIHRYRLPLEPMLELTNKLAPLIANGEWYIHFFSEKGDELYVILLNRAFKLPKIRDSSWDEMIVYGESVGIGRRWTGTIPVHFS